MSKENIEVVMRLFESVERRDRAGVFAAYDEHIVIRESESLPYGGEYRGHARAYEHAMGYLAAWSAVQSDAERELSPTFLDAGEYVVVLWRQRARKGERTLDSSAASVYRLQEGKVVESEMFQDTAAILRFLADEK